MYQNGPLTHRLTQRKEHWIVNMSNSQELRMVVNTWAQNERPESVWVSMVAFPTGSLQRDFRLHLNHTLHGLAAKARATPCPTDTRSPYASLWLCLFSSSFTSSIVQPVDSHSVSEVPPGAASLWQPAPSAPLTNFRTCPMVLCAEVTLGLAWWFGSHRPEAGVQSLCRS